MGKYHREREEFLAWARSKGDWKGASFSSQDWAWRAWQSRSQKDKSTKYLKNIIEAWETLTGDKCYSPLTIQTWLCDVMKPQIENARNAIIDMETPTISPITDKENQNSLTPNVPKPWYKKQGIETLLLLREQFKKEFPKTKCTCDYCIDVTVCNLAYESYNTDGDCLLSK